MAAVKKTKGTLAILTGGGDVPGLNPAILVGVASWTSSVTRRRITAIITFN